MYYQTKILSNNIDNSLTILEIVNSLLFLSNNIVACCYKT